MLNNVFIYNSHQTSQILKTTRTFGNINISTVHSTQEFKWKWYSSVAFLSLLPCRYLQEHCISSLSFIGIFSKIGFYFTEMFIFFTGTFFTSSFLVVFLFFFNFNIVQKMAETPLHIYELQHFSLPSDNTI